MQTDTVFPGLLFHRVQRQLLHQFRQLHFINIRRPRIPFPGSNSQFFSHFRRFFVLKGFFDIFRPRNRGFLFRFILFLRTPLLRLRFTGYFRLRCRHSTAPAVFSHGSESLQC